MGKLERALRVSRRELQRTMHLMCCGDVMSWRRRSMWQVRERLLVQRRRRRHLQQQQRHQRRRRNSELEAGMGRVHRLLLHRIRCQQTTHTGTSCMLGRRRKAHGELLMRSIWVDKAVRDAQKLSLARRSFRIRTRMNPDRIRRCRDEEAGRRV